MISGVFEPILRLIHEACDIPVKRKMETAMVWPITGIKQLPRPSFDILDHRRTFCQKHIAPVEDLLENVIQLPLPSGKSYHIYEGTGWDWIRLSPGKWRVSCSNHVSIPEMSLHCPEDGAFPNDDNWYALLYYERGNYFETFSYCDPDQNGDKGDIVIAAYVRDDMEQAWVRSHDWEV